jgi:hypothetical protein
MGRPPIPRYLNTISEESADFGLNESGKGYPDAASSRGFEITYT